MQHGDVLSWVSVGVLACTGALQGVICVRTAVHYASRLHQGQFPDAVCLMQAFGDALASIGSWPALIIGRNGHNMRAALLQGLSGLILAAVWPLLYGRYGTGAFFWLALLVSTMLLLLADIDSRTWLLPDALTLSLLWLGVTVAWLGWGLVSLHASVAGLGSAYLLMALIRILGARACGPDALGAGDVKLVAALGAWFGDAAVMPVLLAACLGALMYAMVCQRRWRPRGMVPFGPFLAVAGGAALFSPSALQSWF